LNERTRNEKLRARSLDPDLAYPPSGRAVAQLADRPRIIGKQLVRYADYFDLSGHGSHPHLFPAMGPSWRPVGNYPQPALTLTHSPRKDSSHD